MYLIKVQTDDGEAQTADVAKLIIECDDDRQIHVTASREGIIIDVMSGDEVVSTRCMDAELLSEQC